MSPALKCFKDLILVWTESVVGFEGDLRTPFHPFRHGAARWRRNLSGPADSESVIHSLETNVRQHW
jgi:hypothetical protein